MAQYAFYFDSNKCSGCKTCQVACKETYKLPVNNLYRKVLNYQGGTWELNEAGSYVPNGVFGYFVSMACNHCVDPACVANCPTGAMQKDEETGIVWTDHEVWHARGHDRVVRRGRRRGGAPAEGHDASEPHHEPASRCPEVGQRHRRAREPGRGDLTASSWAAASSAVQLFRRGKGKR